MASPWQPPEQTHFDAPLHVVALACVAGVFCWLVLLGLTSVVNYLAVGQ